MFNIFGSKPKNYENLDGTTFRTRYQRAPKAELLDVKTMDKSKEYFVFCRSGNRSGSACDIMSKEGFKAYNLAGGIGAWPR